MPQKRKFLKADSTKINLQFDVIAKAVEDMADSSEGIMPLAADSLRHTRKLIKLYKDAFNAGLKK